WADELPDPNFALADKAVGRGEDARVLQVRARNRYCRLLRPKVCVELRLLSVKHVALSSLRFQLRLATGKSGARLLRLGIPQGKQRLCLCQIGFAAVELRTESLFIRGDLFKLLSGGRGRLYKRFLSLSFQLRAHDVGLRRFNGGLRICNLGLYRLDIRFR